jgi:hypothetical protein
MMGTHWSMHRLSLQKRFTLLRAGSFQEEECGLCKDKRKRERVNSCKSILMPDFMACNKIDKHLGVSRR